ncbi:MAG TPA: TIGR03960 family B12-binding radical SAM protein [Planctomycetes bacterium]|nr:TIGR03960 family B12-binding radical SAM protein [Planctomycetota bacterium]HIJ69952.1 TIGR03960 family B12-binding radical SAM protein [Planctomycetota bacterium]
MKILKEQVEQRFLPFVRKPSRYIGGEINQLKKNLDSCDVKVALCFPDIYEIGMSHTGFAVIYHVLNQLNYIAAERAFAPWIDAEEIMRNEHLPLFTLESKAAVGDFDIVGFSLTNELCYTNMLNMLDLAQIPVRSNARTENDPLIIVGGQASNCCEPIAPFVDIFILGEAEEAVVQLVELIRKQRKAGATKKDLLTEAAVSFSFAYVPSLYSFEYDGQKIESFKSSLPQFPLHFVNAVIQDFENAPVPDAPIVPFTQTVHERVTVEIMRGCPGRCRFCQASFCRRPIRYRSVDKITEIAKQNYHATGFDTVGLLSLSTADYPDLEKLIPQLQKCFEPLHVGISLPSLRVQEQLQLLPKLVTAVRKSGLTIAVEAASERLRKIINKPISDENLFAALEAAYKAGFQKVKLYFMVGLPGETDEDIEQIVDLSFRIARLRKKIDNKTANVNITISWLVPKPHTPFQWLAQKDMVYFQDAKSIILQRKRELNAKFLRFKFHNIERSMLESAMARADRRMGDVIETAWRSGAKFDLWDECFNYDLWKKAFEEYNMNLQECARRAFDPDETLPWTHLGRPKKDYLLKHYRDAIQLLTKIAYPD